MRLEFENPFQAEGRWYRGNIHSHTTRSDGLLGEKELIDAYRACGYHFLSITDHGILTLPDYRPGDLLLIPGEELSVGTSRVGTRFHIVALNIQEELPFEEGDPDEDPQRVIDLILRCGGLPILAHPSWSGLTLPDLLGLEGYVGLEVYNTDCDLAVNRGLSTVHWDALLSSGRRLHGFACDDTHMERRPGLPPDLCGGWIMVKAEEATVEAVVEAMRRGLFYSSNGPEIRSLTLDGGVVHVETSPVKAISFVSNPTMGERYTALEGEMTEAEYGVRWEESYIRVEAVDAYGRRAWTNPIYVSG